MTRLGSGLLRSARGAMVAVALAVCQLTWAAHTSLPPARDLATDAQSAEHSAIPLIVLVSLKGCPHCEAVRRSYLLPLLRDTVDAPTAVIRQVEINGRELLCDFNGSKITHAEFARHHHIKVTPVVLFFDGKGELLTDPLVGSMIADFYGAYFDAAFTEAKSKLRTAQPQVRPPI